MLAVITYHCAMLK